MNTTATVERWARLSNRWTIASVLALMVLLATGLTILFPFNFDRYLKDLEERVLLAPALAGAENFAVASLEAMEGLEAFEGLEHVPRSNPADATRFDSKAEDLEEVLAEGRARRKRVYADVQESARLPKNTVEELALRWAEAEVSNPIALLPFVTQCGVQTQESGFREIVFAMAQEGTVLDRIVVSLNAWRISGVFLKRQSESERAAVDALGRFSNDQRDLLTQDCAQYGRGLILVLMELRRGPPPSRCAAQLDAVVERLDAAQAVDGEPVDLASVVQSTASQDRKVQRWLAYCGCQVTEERGPAGFARIALECDERRTIEEIRAEPKWIRLTDGTVTVLSSSPEAALDIVQAQLHEPGFLRGRLPTTALEEEFGTTVLGCALRVEMGRYEDEGMVRVRCPEGVGERLLTFPER